MTGGIAVILGEFGRNFAAGMSGGIAYLFNESKSFEYHNFNLEMVELESLEETDFEQLHELITLHHEYTRSDIAQKILGFWEEYKNCFIKVMPVDYKRALQMLEKEEVHQKVEV